MKKYFFKDDEQKSIKIQKISDLEKKEIEKELVNEISKGDLKRYCLNYIEANVLPLFKRKDLNAHKKDILKYNTETIIQCCGLNKNYYNISYYCDLSKEKEKNRKKSENISKKSRTRFNSKDKDNYDRANINIEFFKGLGKKKFDFYN